MPPLFPRTTASWTAYEPTAVKRLTASVVATAVTTGVALRLLRSVALTRGHDESWLYAVGFLALWVVILCGVAALHLGNFTVRRWLWRAPAFALIETAAEMATSALLIALELEPLGTSRAHFHDWPAMAMRTALERLAVLSVFALVLGGVVQLVRYAMLRRDVAGEDARP